MLSVTLMLNMLKKWNEQYYGIDGYVYADEQPNTVPLHHLKSTHTKDTWYTNSYATVSMPKLKCGEHNISELTDI